MFLFPLSPVHFGEVPGTHFLNCSGSFMKYKLQVDSQVSAVLLIVKNQADVPSLPGRVQKSKQQQKSRIIVSALTRTTNTSKKKNKGRTYKNGDATHSAEEIRF